MQRRAFMAGCGAAALLPAPALAAAKAGRTFRIMRDGSDIGSHTLTAVSGPNGFEVEITIRIAVKVLGITAYRYEMDNREVWKDGKIVSVSSTVNDDGTKERSVVSAGGDALVINGTYSGTAPLEAVTTSYYATPFLERRPWISTQTGRPLKVSIAPEGRANWFQTSGDLTTKLGYANGEWTGCEFDAGGELAVYEIARQSGSIAELWAQA